MKQLLTKMILLVLAVFLMTEVGCEDLYKPIDYNYQVPEQMEDGLEVAAMEQMGIDTAAVIDAVNRMGRGKYGEVHSILI